MIYIANGLLTLNFRSTERNINKEERTKNKEEPHLEM